MGWEILTPSWKIQFAIGSSYWESRYCCTWSLGPRWLFDINITGPIKTPILKVPLWKTYFNMWLAQDQYSPPPPFVNIKVGWIWTKCTVSLKKNEGRQTACEACFERWEVRKALWSRQLAAAGVFCSVVVFLQKDAIADVSLVFLLPHS